MASSDIPVNVAYIVTILVFPDLGKRHTSSLKGRVVLSRKYILGETTSLYVDFPYFL